MEEHVARKLDGEMAKLADGDRRACSSVFDLLWPVLRAFAARALGPGPDADDAAQGALEKVFHQASDYDPARPALPWALSILAWECRTTLTRRRRRREAPLEGVVMASPENPGAQVEQASLLAALEEAMNHLSPADRATLREAFPGEGPAEKAPRTASFRKRKERALERLRLAWRALHGSD